MSDWDYDDSARYEWSQNIVPPWVEDADIYHSVKSGNPKNKDSNRNQLVLHSPEDEETSRCEVIHLSKNDALPEAASTVCLIN